MLQFEENPPVTSRTERLKQMSHQWLYSCTKYLKKLKDIVFFVQVISGRPAAVCVEQARHNRRREGRDHRLLLGRPHLHIGPRQKQCALPI